MSDDRGADARLAHRIRAGEAEALGELYDAHASTALVTALRVVGDRQEAEDVVHDAFVAVWRKIDRFDAERGALDNATTFAVTVESERVDAPTSDPVLVASLEG